MRIPILSMFMTSPFEGLQKHAEKVKECTYLFQQAIECYISKKCKTFEEFREEVTRLESEADVIKRRIRGHMPRGTLMLVDKFQVFRYLKEQDKVLDKVEDALDWISYRRESGIPPEIEKDFLLLVDTVISPIEELSNMIAQAREYFKSFSEARRMVVKEIINKLREYEHNADRFEDSLKRNIFKTMSHDPVSLFHTIRLAEIIGSIADHAENAGDMMRAMLAR